ncbi:MAG: hypothetical protein ACK56I_15795, partial [bacterium]
ILGVYYKAEQFDALDERNFGNFSFIFVGTLETDYLPAYCWPSKFSVLGLHTSSQALIAG